VAPAAGRNGANGDCNQSSLVPNWRTWPRCPDRIKEPPTGPLPAPMLLRWLPQSMLRQTSVPRMRSSRSHDYSDEPELDWFLESVRPFRRCALFARLYRSLWKFELDEIISWHDMRDGRRARRKHRFCFSARPKSGPYAALIPAGDPITFLRASAARSASLRPTRFKISSVCSPSRGARRV